MVEKCKQMDWRNDPFGEDDSVNGAKDNDMIELTS